MDPRKQQGIDALNQEFRRYEQVEKDQVYRLTENTAEAFDEDYRIRVCDMAQYFDGDDAGKAAFARHLGEAMEEIGFVILVNHGIDPALHARAEADVVRFFEEIPEAAREQFLASRHGSVNQGYFPIAETTIIHPDLVKGWVFCRRAFDLDGNPDFDPLAFWPDPAYERSFRELVAATEPLILPIMQSILRYLGCDPHHYDERLTGTNFGLRLNYYPAGDPAAPPAGGRMLGHEDVDLFTFLPAPSVEGLQVLRRDTQQWVRLDAPPGSIVLNTGDYMQRITNDRLPSTTHRVAQPRQPIEAPRVSVPMAIYVWEDEILEVLPGLGEPRYPPIRAETFHTRITSKYYGDDYADNAQPEGSA
ncbi:MAG: 2-oxoglutarate and iron-dependent oxygenase domain-containing protein [Pseudomonadota bacterium]